MGININVINFLAHNFQIDILFTMKIKFLVHFIRNNTPKIYFNTTNGDVPLLYIIAKWVDHES